MEKLFASVVLTINKAIGSKAFKPRSTVNAALVDSVMVGIADRLSRRGEIKSQGELRTAYENLIAQPRYQEATNRATADEENVRKRLELAREAFGSVQ
jgi:hypothetical protein